MKKLLLCFAALAAGTALAQSPFVDIPPCHWAAGAVAEIAGQPQVDEARARASTYLAENSLRQVFEGLKCDNPDWSLNFIEGAPAAFGRAAAPVSSFALSGLETALAGDRATVSFGLTLALPGAETYQREGRAALVFEDGGWKVSYASLAALELPLFPR